MRAALEHHNPASDHTGSGFPGIQGPAKKYNMQISPWILLKDISHWLHGFGFSVLVFFVKLWVLVSSVKRFWTITSSHVSCFNFLFYFFFFPSLLLPTTEHCGCSILPFDHYGIFGLLAAALSGLVVEAAGHCGLAGRIFVCRAGSPRTTVSGRTSLQQREPASESLGGVLQRNSVCRARRRGSTPPARRTSACGSSGSLPQSDKTLACD